MRDPAPRLARPLISLRLYAAALVAGELHTPGVPMTAPTSTTLTIATMNDDWGSAGSNIDLVSDCDVVMIQEGKRAKYAELVDDQHGVYQDTSTDALAGSVLIWRKNTGLKMGQKHGWTFAVRAPGLLGRYLNWAHAEPGGRKVLFIAAHRPPKRAAKWWHPFDVALAARCRMAQRRGRLVVVGIDANQNDPELLAKMCGLVWHSIRGYCIDGFLASGDVEFVGEIEELPKGNSDHHPLKATIRIPAPAPKPKPVKYPPAFEHVVYNGRLMDQKTKAFVQKMEKRLGYPLTIVQGCYNPGGVSQSAGTHDGGGVVDLAPWDYAKKVHVARALGGFFWHREAIPDVWGEHIHGGIRNQGRLSPAAQAQQRDYDGDPPRNGLATHAVDPVKFHPDPPVTFAYPPKR